MKGTGQERKRSGKRLRGLKRGGFGGRRQRSSRKGRQRSRPAEIRSWEGKQMSNSRWRSGGEAETEIGHTRRMPDGKTTQLQELTARTIARSALRVLSKQQGFSRLALVLPDHLYWLILTVCQRRLQRPALSQARVERRHVLPLASESRTTILTLTVTTIDITIVTTSMGKTQSVLLRPMPLLAQIKPPSLSTSGLHVSHLTSSNSSVDPYCARAPPRPP